MALVPSSLEELHAGSASMALSTAETAAQFRMRMTTGCDVRGWVCVTFSPRMARCTGRQHAAIKIRASVQLR
ncbi:hypothetical protein GCM10018777_08660 [Streptomyces albogriseolus]|nr:hypothetical protein GCM10018777_08660 [Streptomyces viridodiastaticus]